MQAFDWQEKGANPGWSDNRVRAITPALCKRTVFSASIGEPLEVWESTCDLIRNRFEKGRIGCAQHSKSRHYPFSLVTKPESPLSCQVSKPRISCPGFRKKCPNPFPTRKTKAPIALVNGRARRFTDFRPWGLSAHFPENGNDPFSGQTNPSVAR